MNVKLFLLILICLCGTGLSQSGSELKFADRIIRAEKRPVSSDDDEGFPAIEVVRVYIGRTAIGINKKFSAEDTWLGDLRIEVKNVSRETIKCVGLSLGLLADIDTLLQTHESWPRGVGFYRGQCDVRKHPNTALDLKPGRTIILEKKDAPGWYAPMFEEAGKLKKAVFHANTFLKLGEGKQVELPLSFSSTTLYVGERAY